LDLERKNKTKTSFLYFSVVKRRRVSVFIYLSFPNIRKKKKKKKEGFERKNIYPFFATVLVHREVG
jgi:hypothetical protein